MNEDLQIYFNPNCSKCRSALEILDAEGSSFEVVRYLENPLERRQLEVLVDNLSDPIANLVRKDRRFAELGLNAANFVNRDSVVNLLLKHPDLMQRPLIHKNGTWSIARSPEKVLEISRA